MKTVDHNDIYYKQYKEYTTVKGMDGRKKDVHTGNIDKPFVECPKCKGHTKVLVSEIEAGKIRCVDCDCIFEIEK